MKLIFLLLYFSFTLFANQKISVQLEWKHQFEFAGFYAAKEQGYYDDIGLDVELKEIQNGINVSDEVIAGNSEFGISSSSLILDKLQKKPVVLIASYFKQNALALVVSPEIKTISDLKNKKIMATKYEFEQTSLAVMLKESGITQDKYTLVAQDYQVDKFIHGEVDAMSVFKTNQLYYLDKQNIQYNLLNPSDYGIYSYDVELFTSEVFANSNPELIHNFKEATNKGWLYAFKHKEEIAQLIYKKYNSDKSLEALMYEAKHTENLFKTHVFKIGSVIPELIELNAVIYKKLGLVDERINLKQLLNSYIFNHTHDSSNPNEIHFTRAELNYLNAHKTIKIANEMDWAPFDYNEFGKATGMSIEYIQLLFNKLGLNYSFVNSYTWPELLQKFEKHEIDVMPAFYKSKEREAFTYYTTPYHQGELALYILKDTKIKQLSELKNKKIGVEAGDASLTMINKYFSDSIIVKSLSSNILFENLLQKKVDAIICNPLLVKHYLSNRDEVKIETLETLNLSQKNANLYLYISV